VEFGDLDRASIDYVLTTTRAVRRRLDLDRPVEQSILLECLDLALQAPTGGNRQEWRWIVVTDPKTREGLAELYRDAENGAFRRQAVESAGSDPQTARVYRSADYLKDVLGQVPVHVIPCIEGRLEDLPEAGAAARMASILPAAWSFMLALRSRGLGSVWTTMHLHRERQAAALLGVPSEEYTQVALIPVGYTIGTQFRPAERVSVERVTYVDRWGQVPATPTG
jgi:nitroreductase